MALGSLTEEGILISERACEQCGIAFIPWTVKPPRGRFCSQSCSTRWKMANTDLRSKLYGPGALKKKSEAKVRWFQSGSPAALAEIERMRNLNTRCNPASLEKMRRSLKALYSEPDRPCNGIVYLITNTANGKIYVGKTTRTLVARWHAHVRDAEKHGNTSIRKAIRKYGPTCFSIQELSKATSSKQLNELEINEIKLRSSNVKEIGYNETTGGDGGWSPSEETRAKMSAAKLGKKLTPEHVANLIRSKPRGPAHHQYGKPQSAETIAKIRATKLGSKASDETRAKRKAAWTEEMRAKQRLLKTGRAASPETRKKMSVSGLASWSNGKRAKTA